MLEHWGYTEAEMAAVEKAPVSRDNRICACGHPARAHTSESNSEYHQILKNAGRNECRPTRIQCPCVSFNPVIEASDVRKFSFKTISAGPGHALSRGIQAAQKADVDLNWVAGVSCARCSLAGIVLYPVALDRERKEASVATPVNVMLCGPCRTTLAEPPADSGEEV